MKVSIWYHITEKLPSNSGMYLAYKSYSIGDDYTDIACFYYDLYTSKWFNHKGGRWENVQYWCELDVDYFDQPLRQHISPAEQIAVDAVIKAVRNYELISGITNG